MGPPAGRADDPLMRFATAAARLIANRDLAMWLLILLVVVVGVVLSAVTLPALPAQTEIVVCNPPPGFGWNTCPPEILSGECVIGQPPEYMTCPPH